MAMELGSTSSMNHRMPYSVIVGDTRGKHRLFAELKRLEQETRFLEEELDELDKTAKVSSVCHELLLIVQSEPDPLVLVTNEPVNPTWERWFEGPQDSQLCSCSCRCRCWLL